MANSMEHESETDVSFGVNRACVQGPECLDEGFGIHFTVN